MDSSSSFESQLTSKIQHFKLYENKQNQAAALQHVPLDDLREIARAKFESAVTEKLTVEEIRRNVQDILFTELMDWFKNEFFSWMDTPLCPTCSNPTTFLKHGTPTIDEQSKSASRVELFCCKSCYPDGREVARFPRYNNPVVLLGTRTGRCGEWANCFCLICRAAGFEVRHVTDWTDHVWLEVFSASMKPNRWLHADPCENSVDSPLLYEQGWGKKLTYVIAVSQDDIQDVTWRYVVDPRETLTRRKLCNENWLVKTILKLRKQLQLFCSQERRRELLDRLAIELAEFLTPKTKAVKDTEKIGRQSGSLAWKLARQELGDDATSEGSSHVWKISQESLVEKKYSLVFDCANNSYTVKGSNSKMHGWQNGVFKNENIFRKEEKDWNMAYICRKEHSDCEKAVVGWKFSAEGLAHRITAINISIPVFLFSLKAMVSLKVVTDQGQEFSLLDSNSHNGVFDWDSKNSLKPCTDFSLLCELKGGEGNTAWQHAQLCRQSLTSKGDSMLTIETILGDNI